MLRIENRKYDHMSLTKVLHVERSLAMLDLQYALVAEEDALQTLLILFGHARCLPYWIERPN